MNQFTNLVTQLKLSYSNMKQILGLIKMKLQIKLEYKDKKLNNYEGNTLRQTKL